MSNVKAIQLVFKRFEKGRTYVQLVHLICLLKKNEKSLVLNPQRKVSMEWKSYTACIQILRRKIGHTSSLLIYCLRNRTKLNYLMCFEWKTSIR